MTAVPRTAILIVATLLFGGEPLFGQHLRAPFPSWEAPLPAVTSTDRAAPPPAGMGSVTRSHTLTGLVIGGVIGAGVAGVLLATHCSDADPDTQCSTDGGLAIVALFAVPGALAGALIGSLIRTKR